jgi:hypothetical protein
MKGKIVGRELKSEVLAKVITDLKKIVHESRFYP